MAGLLRSVRLVLERLVIFAAVVMCVSLALFLTDSMLKKEREEYRRMDRTVLDKSSLNPPVFHHVILLFLRM